MANSLFVTFEGGEGSGKTTVMKLVGEELTRRGYQVLLTREPGGVTISEEIREVILDKKNTMMDSRTEALLYAASRRQHLVEIVNPALKEGKIVLSDRYIDSSLAYQGYARGIGMDEVYDINLFATDGRLPDVTFFFDIKPEDAFKRIYKDSRHELNRLDLEKNNFHEMVYSGYKILADKYKDRIVSIDATKTIEEEIEDIVSQILARLG